MATPADYGFFSVPRNFEELLNGKHYLHKPTPVDVAKAVKFPESAVVQAAREFAKAKLPPETFNHSHRVFYYGTVIIAQQFPEHANNEVLLETYALTCLLHDIATADEFLYSTRMSFDFYGAFVAREFLLNAGAPQDEADAVAEGILRHQDVEVNGAITFIGLIIQLTTLVDNAGSFLSLMAPETIDSVVTLYPRLGWTSCFSRFVETEISLKPWCHSTAVTDFVNVVKGNKYFIERYESD
ncbi:hypothetical protein POJ06DRAFT_55850 [Lipomyces tetrasporus]|uniref:HD domain-containing protein n=1 Tax=Lipomyces tetrasporus TaxID=54092 RepID=A0AAD7VVB0_9ASCO|nr:uncharacterized protein POJ06DRAFT_55850 [Lipomyces tetrasporus]KAJ8102791.1 hypothetical protein POJ06DRAFT_55850 [Lipomyces tetrasporus]